MFITALVSLLLGGPAARAQPPLLLDVGGYGAVQLPEQLPRREWLGLCASPSGDVLKPIGLRLRPFQDLMAGDSGRERTGREVQAPACVQPRALFHGFLFRAGAVASGRIEEASAALGDTKAVLEETPCAEGVGSVFLREGATRRLLFTYDDSNCPRARIRWVGDLDRDGQLDLLVEQAGDGTGLWLFLSSQGKSAAEWRAAASTYHGGC